MSTYYINKKTFLEDLDKRVEGVDLRKSGRMANYGFALKEGKSFNCPSVASLVKALNKLQEGILSPKVAKIAGTGFIVSWNKDNIVTKEVEIVEEVVEDITPPTIEEIVEEVSTEVVEEVTETVEPEVIPETKTKPKKTKKSPKKSS